MRLGFVHTTVFATLVTLLIAACQPPPCPTTPVDSIGSSAAPAPAAPQSPRPFTHTSKDLFAELRLGWNLGNSLDVPEGETALMAVCCSGDAACARLLLDAGALPHGRSSRTQRRELQDLCRTFGSDHIARMLPV